jgi:phosphoribosylanthranilate isomerase
MGKVKVKICGITNSQDAKRAIEAGADLLGFNFYAGSSRYVAPAKARRIVRQLPKSISMVGVFVNETETKMLEIASTVGLDYLQLHGDESPDTIARLGLTLPVIKAVQARQSFRPAQLSRFKTASAILLDGFDGRHRGGTGKTFNWEIARRSKPYGRIVLAGGLRPDNVGEAIRVAKPYAVDVCSGVESKPGKKDPAKMKALMSAVKATQKRKVKR